MPFKHVLTPCTNIGIGPYNGGRSAVQTVLATLSTTTPTMHGVLLHLQLLMAAALSGVLTMAGTTVAGTPMV